LIDKLHPQIVEVFLSTRKWIQVLRQVQEIVTALVNAVSVEAMPKFAEKVASPSTETPTVIESMIALKRSVLPLSAVKVMFAAAVLPVNATVGDVALSRDPVIEPVTSMIPTARLRVAFPNPVISVLARVKFAVHDLMIPPIAFVIAMLPLTPLIPAICISC